MISQYAAPTLHRDIIEIRFRSFEQAAASLREIECDGAIEIDLVASDEDGESEIAVTVLWNASTSRYEFL
jgi:hypothetical protein